MEGDPRAKLAEPKVDGELRKRAVVTFVLQAVPWVLYFATLLVVWIVDAALNINDDTKVIFAVMCLAGVLLLGVLCALGAIVACLNKSEGISIAMMITLYVICVPTYISYFIVSIESGAAVYMYVVGFPLLILTVGHLVWAIFNVKQPFSVAFSTTLCILDALCASIILLVHYAIKNSTHPYVVLECIAASLFHLVIAGSWCAAAKAALPLSYLRP